MKSSHLVDNALSKSQIPPKKNTNIRYEKTFKLVTRFVQQIPKTLQNTAIALGCPPRQRQMVNCYYRRYCVLEMQRSEAPGMEITWTPPWWRLSFLVWEGSIKTLKWEKNEQSYPAMILMTRTMTNKACTSSMDTYFVANTL